MSASVSSHGEITPADGAHSEPQTASERFGSMARASSPVRSFIPGTPFSTPRA